MTATDEFLNYSAYRFAPLSGLKELRVSLLEKGAQAQLKGTILLSTEGINLFVAGRPEAARALLAEIRRVPGLEDLNPKESFSDHQPFTRLLVRIKREIIAFGVDGIEPGKRTSPKLPAQELKKWFDEGREFFLLDTRNDYEIKLGTFRGAADLGIKHFRDFPKASQGLSEEAKKKPLVMFCTGGIRCEKAGPYLESQGFEQVYQLDGGILKYFEECGSAHYDGECFVFDQRVGLDPSLQETPSTQCFVCLEPLSAADQQDSRYTLGRSCPFCFKTSEEQMALAIDRRHALLRHATTPLPGSEPYENRRPLDVPARLAGATLVDFLCGILPHVSRTFWEQQAANGRLVDRQDRAVSAESRVTPGERYFHRMPLESEPPVNADIRVVYEDGAIVVLEKPAPLPVHPCGRFNRNSLQRILEKAYAPQKPHAAHRLDSSTSGLMVFARTRRLAGLLQPQFEKGEVEKRYLARVHGHPPEDAFECTLPISEEVGEIGSRTASASGLPSHTLFRVQERFSDGTSLLEIRPLTGRTNQIRVHLWEMGWPICGDLLYLPGRKLGQAQTTSLDGP
ncbi:pseudouridine synthase, partial [bacterium]|nr:pseudouridine synthase [bacterium]